MSEPVLAIPLSRLFGQPMPPAGPSATERHQQAIEAATAAGRAAAEADLMPRIAGLEAMLETVRAETARELEAGGRRSAAVIAALEEAFAQAIASLALSLAGRVLEAEPAIRGETLQALVAEALAGLPDGAAGVLRMNPADAAGAPALPSGWAIAADPDLAAGQVIAVRGPSLSAAGLSLRLAQASSALEAGQ